MSYSPTPDPLTAVLDTLRFCAVQLYRSRCAGGWGIAFDASEPADVTFHLVLDGECFLVVDGFAPNRLRAGDFAVFPRPVPNALRSSPAEPTAPIERWLRDVGVESDGELVFSGRGDGPVCRVLCGKFLFETGGDAPRELLRTLPPVLVTRASRDDGVVDPIAALMLAESRVGGPGGGATLARLSEVLLIRAVRQFLSENCPITGAPPPTGWLRALMDTRIAPALSAIHGQIDAPHTVESLARACAMSRSAFAAHFAKISGEPPLTYVARWRAFTAARLLRTTDLSTLEIAGRVGFSSESAFRNAFVRCTGETPGAARRRREKFPTEL